MARSDVVYQVKILVAAFNRNNEIQPETLGIYAEKLQDIEPELLKAAVNRLIEDVKFFPAISEIRQMAARLAGLLPPSPAEALAMVRKADVSRPVYRRDGSYAYTEHEWDWSHASDAEREFCEEVISRVGDSVDFDSDGKHFGWDVGFQKVADEIASAFSRDLLSDLSHARLPAPKLKRLPPDDDDRIEAARRVGL